MGNLGLQGTINKYFPFLVEIRKRLLFLAGVFIVSTVLGFFFYEKIIVVALKLFNLHGINIVFTSPFQFMSLAVTCGVSIGIIAIIPLAIVQILSFLKPALNKKEFKAIISMVPVVIVLFIIGFIFGLVIMRYVIILFNIKSTELNIGNVLDISKLLSDIMITSSLMGLAFEFPVVLTALIHFKVMKIEHAKKLRPIFYIVACFFVLFLPPIDILSDLFLFLPLVFLFEITLILNRFVLKTT